MSKRNILSGVLFAMEPNMLGTIADLVDAHARGDLPRPASSMTETVVAHLDGGDITAGPVTASTMRSEGRQYAVTQDGIAVIGLSGVMARNPGCIEEACMGVTNVMAVARAIESAQEDESVRAIVLDIDSPGGTVNGTVELANAVSRAAKAKPVVAYTGGSMCSAAYWTGSAASKIVAVPTATVGSIGVATVHYDRSGEDEKAGVKRTVLYSGAYKRMASDERPLTDEGRAYVQGMLDDMYAQFVDAVAANRGVDVDTVLSRMADGKVFVGPKALKAGLIDMTGDMQTALALAAELADNPTPTQEDDTMKGEGKSQPQAQGQGAATISAQPDSASVAATEEALHAAEQRGVEAERARVMEIIGAGGPADITAAAIKNGTPAADVYRQVLEAERKGRIDATAEMQKSLGDSVGADGQQKESGPAAAPRPKGDYLSAVRQYAADHKVDMAEAAKAVARDNPDLHAAYLNGGSK